MIKAEIQAGFWSSRLEVNARKAIFHQWNQLTASGCIENFRIAAGESDGWREGWFFADSDAYKWLEAAVRIQAAFPDAQLAEWVDDFIALLGRAQQPDGYLFTYNQIHFPGSRWQNLQIEHELYCHGHLIEAGVSHFEATGRVDLLEISRRAADRVVADFLGKDPFFTPGHEEIEIALLRLHQAAPNGTAYLDLARQFIEQRGRIPNFGLAILRQNLAVGKRTKWVHEKKQVYLSTHPGYKAFQLPPGNVSKKPANTTLRWYASALSGKYFQQHAPVREQKIPVGHSVRFAYLETAAAMLSGITGDLSLVPTLEQAWEHMVTRRMYVTGGIGSLPGLEGFGKDYEIDPEYAYAETCAALGCLFWNWEMAQLTHEAKYSDLFEWQLYNAAAVGMGLDGSTYLYNNPLACRGEVIRRPWYAVPCCPSNLSRTWQNLGKYLFSTGPNELRIHQYISSDLTCKMKATDGSLVTVRMRMDSALPWEGRIRIHFSEISTPDPAQPALFELLLRQPSWAQGMQVRVNRNPVGIAQPPQSHDAPTASGYDPRRAAFHSLRRFWSVGDEVDIQLDMPVRLLNAHLHVKGHHGKITVTRGPLVFCLEDVDHPGLDIFSLQVDRNSLATEFASDFLDGSIKIIGKTKNGKPLIFIPYFLWGNRGPSRMVVWVNE